MQRALRLCTHAHRLSRKSWSDYGTDAPVVGDLVMLLRSSANSASADAAEVTMVSPGGVTDVEALHVIGCKAK